MNKGAVSDGRVVANERASEGSGRELQAVAVAPIDQRGREENEQ
jgi:hypothetical protein